MIDMNKITMAEWIIGGGFFTFFCVAVWRLLRAMSPGEPVTHEIRNFDIASYKHRN